MASYYLKAHVATVQCDHCRGEHTIDSDKSLAEAITLAFAAEQRCRKATTTTPDYIISRRAN